MHVPIQLYIHIHNLVGHSWEMEYVNVMYTKCDACTHTIVHTNTYNLVGHSRGMEYVNVMYTKCHVQFPSSLHTWRLYKM